MDLTEHHLETLKALWDDLQRSNWTTEEHLAKLGKAAGEESVPALRGLWLRLRQSNWTEGEHLRKLAEAMGQRRLDVMTVTSRLAGKLTYPPRDV